MTKEVKLYKKVGEGQNVKYILVKAGVYFSLTPANVKEVNDITVKLLDEMEDDNTC